jgi:DNA-binding CsgD family transcriptional regulator
MTKPCQNRLTHIEKSCLQSLAHGEPVTCIAEQFDKSPRKIEGFLESARRKLTANTNVEAVARAIQLGLIS